VTSTPLFNPLAGSGAVARCRGGRNAGSGTAFFRRLHEHRDPVAMGMAWLCGALIFLATQALVLDAPEAPAPAVELSLVELPDTPPPPEQARPEPPPPPPPPMAKPLPVPRPSEPLPPPVPMPAVETVPPPAVPQQTPVVSLPRPVPQAPPEEPVAAPEQPRSNPAAEGAYQSRARAQVEKNRHYPDEAQQLGMTGAAVIVYAIGRDGRLVRAGIERSSGYPMLDQAALRAVRQTRFDPFPADAWVNLKEQIFRTRIVFDLE